MPAPKGNQFWKLRSKHGRDRLFESPDLLWEAACEFFEWCDKHPWTKTETTKKPKGAKGYRNEIKTIPTQRPYTLKGLTVYLGCNIQYINEFKKSLPKREEEMTETQKDFSAVISRIEGIIETQKFEGAAVGVFNANIISRDLGLKDRTDITTNDEPIELVKVKFERYKKED